MIFDIATMYTGGAADERGQTDATESEVTRADLAGLMPVRISECALYTGRTGVCSGPSGIAAIAEAYGDAGSAEATLSLAKAATNCGTERCVLEKVGTIITRREISLMLKVRGPTDAALLTNVHIDKTLAQWVAARSDFFAYNFNMLNYAAYSYRDGHVISSPDTLATIDFRDLAGRGIKYAACVINSDRYQGPGKHWMALFVDSASSPATVEFFNSSGRAPAPEWINWMDKTRVQLEGLGMQARVVRATSIQQQESRSECGLYSLFYIWARLHGVPHDFFASRRIPDKFMFEFRQHLFEDPTRPEIRVFNWDEYKKVTEIK